MTTPNPDGSQWHAGSMAQLKQAQFILQHKQAYWVCHNATFDCWVTELALQAQPDAVLGWWRIARRELESFLASRQASTPDRVYRRRTPAAVPINVTQYF